MNKKIRRAPEKKANKVDDNTGRPFTKKAQESILRQAKKLVEKKASQTEIVPSFADLVGEVFLAESVVSRGNALRLLLEDFSYDQLDSRESPYVIYVFSRPEAYLFGNFRSGLVGSVDNILSCIDDWNELSENAIRLEEKYKRYFCLFSKESGLSVSDVFGADCKVISHRQGHLGSEVDNRILSVYRGMLLCLDLDFSKSRNLYNKMSSLTSFKSSNFYNLSKEKNIITAFNDLRAIEEDLVIFSEHKSSFGDIARGKIASEDFSIVSTALEKSHREIEVLSEKLLCATTQCDDAVANLSSDLIMAITHRDAAKIVNDKLSSEVLSLRNQVNSLESRFYENEIKSAIAIKNAESEKFSLLSEIKVLRENSESIQIEIENVLVDSSRKFLELSQATERVSALEMAWGKFRPDDLWIDLRAERVGGNWYPAEVDGRWTGPGDVSVVSVPPLAQGCYRIEFEIVDSIDPMRLSELQVSINDADLCAVEIEWLSGFIGGYPCIASAFANFVFDADFSIVKLIVPFCERPKISLVDDMRALGVRVKTLRLSKL